MNKDLFIEKLDELGITYTEDKLSKLEDYYNFLYEYNKNVNLTAITSKEDVYLKHFYDSLTITKCVDLTKYSSLIDIGSGAGFPGVVLKIFFPDLNITLLDSNGKKTTFLEELIDKLDLKNINVVNDRAEEYAKNHLNEFDIVTSRAVAYMDIILHLSVPLIKKDGLVVLMKGKLDSELKVLEKHYKDLNIRNYKINNFNLIEDLERNIIVLEKANDTDKVLSYSNIIKINKKWNQ